MTSAVLSERKLSRRGAGWWRGLAHNGWAVGVWLLLGLLLLWYATLIPKFGSFQMSSISKNSLPLAYLAIGQAIIVIAGGIDLSLGALLLLTNVIAARFMADQPVAIVLLVALATILLIATLNAFVAYVITISGVPDIVVTLATSYIWSGLALWILPSPGGGTAPEMRWLFTGSTSGIGGNYLVPILMMLIPAIIVFIWSRRSRLGLSIYAIGSSSVAARLAGLNVQRAKLASFALGGVMAALAGLATVAITGTGDPRFSVGANATLNSVAAIVLGGVALTGGSGSVLGVVATAVILIMLNPILTAMGILANNAQVIQGVLIAGVMMIGGLATLLREEEIMSQPTVPVKTEPGQATTAGLSTRLQRLAAENPTWILVGVLVLLILITGVIEPNYLSVGGARNTLLQAAPLGILAGAQTILMLSGGIDLSVAIVATGAANVAANQSPNGAAIAILLGLVVGLVVGTLNGVGVTVFRVNPLIMTLAMSGILLGLFTAWTQTILQGSTEVADFIRLLGGGSFFGNRIPYSVVLWAGIALLLIWLLRRSGWGRLLYAIGDNEVAVRLAGVRVWQVRITAYMVAGLLGAIGGMLLAGRNGMVDLQLGNAFLLPSIAAVVIGGTSTFGGVGGYTGTILGVLILSVLNSMLTYLNVGQAIQQVVYGVIVLSLAWGYAGLTRRG